MEASIKIEVTPEYLAQESKPNENNYVFSYKVRIHNNGEHAVQVVSRHWIITNGHNKTQEVSGLGVIGKQPLIASKDSFTYESFCVLETNFGTMQGFYHCVGENGIPFDVEIPLFVLTTPQTLH